VKQDRAETFVRRWGLRAGLAVLGIMCLAVGGFYLSQVLPFFNPDRDRVAEWENGEAWAQALYSQIFALRGWSTPGDFGISPEGFPAHAGPFFGRALDATPPEPVFGRALSSAPVPNEPGFVLSPAALTLQAPRLPELSLRSSPDVAAAPLGPSASAAPEGSMAAAQSVSRTSGAAMLALAAMPVLAYGIEGLEWDRKAAVTRSPLPDAALVNSTAPEEIRLPPPESSASDQGDKASNAENQTPESGSESPAAAEKEIFGGIAKETTPLTPFGFVESPTAAIRPFLPEQGSNSEVFSTLLSQPPGPPPLFVEDKPNPGFFVSTSGEVLPAPPAGPDDSTPAGIFESAIDEATLTEAALTAPEPATMWLLASGLISLGIVAVWRRRRF
jgi:hypothetical protein